MNLQKSWSILSFFSLKNVNHSPDFLFMLLIFMESSLCKIQFFFIRIWYCITEYSYSYVIYNLEKCIKISELRNKHEKIKT